jgi:hypothetical protein
LVSTAVTKLGSACANSGMWATRPRQVKLMISWAEEGPVRQAVPPAPRCPHPAHLSLEAPVLGSRSGRGWGCCSRPGTIPKLLPLETLMEPFPQIEIPTASIYFIAIRPLKKTLAP